MLMRVDLPTMIVDLDIFDENTRRLAQYARDAGWLFFPHGMESTKRLSNAMFSFSFRKETSTSDEVHPSTRAYKESCASWRRRCYARVNVFLCQRGLCFSLHSSVRGQFKNRDCSYGTTQLNVQRRRCSQRNMDSTTC